MHASGSAAIFGFGSHLTDPEQLSEILSAAEFTKDNAAWKP